MVFYYEVRNANAKTTNARHETTLKRKFELFRRRGIAKGGVVTLRLPLYATGLGGRWRQRRSWLEGPGWG